MATLSPTVMDTFGQLLRKCRRQSQDPMKGGALTQERFGELIGHELGDAGYSGAAVSDWERDKSKINAADRLVLLALLAVLVKHGGVQTPAEAETLLHAGDYRGLNSEELQTLFWPHVAGCAGSRRGPI